jgi:hypothetical protein
VVEGVGAGEDAQVHLLAGQLRCVYWGGGGGQGAGKGRGRSQRREVVQGQQPTVRSSNHRH